MQVALQLGLKDKRPFVVIFLTVACLIIYEVKRPKYDIQLVYLGNNVTKLRDYFHCGDSKCKYDTDAEFFTKWKMEIEKRKRRVKAVCMRHYRKLRRTFNQSEFVSDINKRILFSKNAKAGTTSWLKLILRWSNVSIPDRNDSLMYSLSLQNLPTINPKANLNNTLIFTSVRHPFTRIVSAYRDKIHEGYRKELQQEIINTYRSKNRSEILKWTKINNLLGINNEAPTFEEFVKFISDKILKCDKGVPNVGCMAQMDRHWRPFYDRIAPCDISYSIISKIETFAQDLRFLKIMIKSFPSSKIKNSTSDLLFDASTSVHAHKSSGISTSALTKEVFALLDANTTDNLKRAFYFDFLLFGYHPKHAFEY